MPPTNQQVKRALLHKLGVTPQRLSQLVGRRKRELPMTTPQAVYTLAHDAGIDIGVYLTPEELADVRGLSSQLRASSRLVDHGATEPKKRSPRTRALAVVSIGTRAKDVPGLSRARAVEAQEMAEVYPLLYVFENSAREIIERVLRAAVGDDWWHKSVSTGLQRKAESRKAVEAREPWHGRRGARLIDYLDLPDLSGIVKGGKAWPCFDAIGLFPRPSWFEELVNDMNVSRRVLAHMNPLGKDDIRHIQATFRKWERQLEAKSGEIPELA